MAYTKEVIREKVTTDPAWTERAVLALYHRQTEHEQVAYQTVDHNGQGFNATDAGILTSFAEWLMRGRHFTPKQLELAQRKVAKYAGQLADIANGN